ncbi:hypothetical protein AB0B25_26475 [Nocardia sp. NPDC049190]|uniref:hypothetical protein n=1 Tax=Nocardia sp. NPDC049190 TaxID=3155650 RepID=UPI0033D9703F
MTAAEIAEAYRANALFAAHRDAPEFGRPEPARFDPMVKYAGADEIVEWPGLQHARDPRRYHRRPDEE